MCAEWWRFVLQYGEIYQSHPNPYLPLPNNLQLTIIKLGNKQCDYVTVN